MANRRILPIVPKNCMKMRKFGPPLLDPTLLVTRQGACLFMRAAMVNSLTQYQLIVDSHIYFPCCPVLGLF